LANSFVFVDPKLVSSKQRPKWHTSADEHSGVIIFCELRKQDPPREAKKVVRPAFIGGLEETDGCMAVTSETEK
jgi:hypothetical protein